MPGLDPGTHAVKADDSNPLRESGSPPIAGGCITAWMAGSSPGKTGSERDSARSRVGSEAPPTNASLRPRGPREVWHDATEDMGQRSVFVACCFGGWRFAYPPY